MRLILRKHSVKGNGNHLQYSDKEWNKLLNEKGILENTKQGDIGTNNVAGIIFKFKAFDPQLPGCNILVHSFKDKGNFLHVESANGNNFIFEKI